MVISRAWLLGVALGALLAGTAAAQSLPLNVQLAQNGAGFVTKSWISSEIPQNRTSTATIPVSISTASDFIRR